MRNYKMEEKRQPAALNRVLTKQDKKRIRDLGRDYIVPDGVNPTLIKDYTAYLIKNCQTTLQIKTVAILNRKIVDEAKAKGIAPGVPIKSVITDERIKELFAEAEAEAKKPLN